MKDQYLGTLFMVSAPSGAGKTSLVNAWLENVDELEVSVSYTTRSQRGGEVDGVDYHFVDQAQFQRMIHEQAFFEYAKVFDHYYGTTKAAILEKLERGLSIVLEIDWQGAQLVRQLYPSVVSIFVLPPSYEVLKKRLIGRGREQDDEIQKRLQQAREEMSHYNEADYLIINDNFQQALDSLCELYRVHQLSVERQQFKCKELLLRLLD